MCDNNLNVTTTKLYVGDSCYLINNKPNEKHSIVVRNVLKGKWKTSLTDSYFVASHSKFPHSASDDVVPSRHYDYAGSVTVDAAHVCIGSLTKLSRMSNEDYEIFISGPNLSEDQKATFVTTDDGRYDVYLGHDKDGRIVAIAVVIDYNECDGCGEHVDDCECCEECGCYDCECCEECGCYYCECCEECGYYCEC